MIFAVMFAAMFAGHSFGDHWVQTHKQAIAKGALGPAGRAACMRHVVGLTGTKMVFLLFAELATGVRVAWFALVLALAIDAASHYWADRAAFHPSKDYAVTLEKLANLLNKGGFYRLGRGTVNADGQPAPTLGTGAYALDQSFHVAMLFVAALIMEALS